MDSPRIKSLDKPSPSLSERVFVGTVAVCVAAACILLTIKLGVVLFG